MVAETESESAPAPEAVPNAEPVTPLEPEPKSTGPFGIICGLVDKCHVVVQILICAAIGAAIGLILSATEADPLWGIWLGMPGTLYLRGLKLLVVPLVFCSVVTGVASLHELGVSTGKLGSRTVLLYFVTTILGVVEGLAVTYALKPAWNADEKLPEVVSVQPSSVMFDSGALITLRNDAYTGTPPYYNEQDAAYATFTFKDAPVSTNISSLVYYYEKAVSFNLPIVVGPAGPYGGNIGGFQVFQSDGSLAFSSLVDAQYLHINDGKDGDDGSEISESFVRLLYSIVPDNIIAIFYGGHYGGASGGPDMLSMIVFAVAFSIGLMVIKVRMVGENSQPDVLTPFFQETLQAVLYVVLGIVAYTPLAVGCLILSAFSANSMDDLSDAMKSLGVLVAGMVACLAFHMLVTMPSIAYFFTRTNPYTHLMGMSKAITLAMGCASSAVVLPVNMSCCERLGYSPGITRFVLSLGATVSMDGAAIYIPAAMIWLAAQNGMTLDFGQVIILSVIATVSITPAAARAKLFFRPWCHATRCAHTTSIRSFLPPERRRPLDVSHRSWIQTYAKNLNTFTD
jgi:Na+/H+-dicarboxylate symporter